MLPRTESILCDVRFVLYCTCSWGVIVKRFDGRCWLWTNTRKHNPFFKIRHFDLKFYSAFALHDNSAVISDLRTIDRPKRGKFTQNVIHLGARFFIYASFRFLPLDIFGFANVKSLTTYMNCMLRLHQSAVSIVDIQICRIGARTKTRWFIRSCASGLESFPLSPTKRSKSPIFKQW